MLFQYEPPGKTLKTESYGYTKERRKTIGDSLHEKTITL